MKFWAVLIKICSRVLTDDRNLQIIPQYLVTVLDRFLRLNPVLYKLPPCILIANKDTCWDWNKCKYVFLCRIRARSHECVSQYLPLNQELEVSYNNDSTMKLRGLTLSLFLKEQTIKAKRKEKCFLHEQDKTCFVAE